MDSRTTASPVKVPDSRDNRLERGSPQTASTAITPFQAFLDILENSSSPR